MEESKKGDIYVLMINWDFSVLVSYSSHAALY